MPKPDETRDDPARASLASGRRRAVLSAASHAGLLAGDVGRIGARVRKTLVEAAKAQTGIASDTELLEYALATVALEDHFAETLIALEGSVPEDLDLEF
jgi:hypothetical protein